MATQAEIEASSAVRYSRLRTILKKRIALAMAVAKSASPSSEHLRDSKDDMKGAMKDMELCSLSCKETACADLAGLQTECDQAVAELTARLDSVRVSRDKEGSVSLTKLKTPVFSGDVCDYMTFKASFMDLVGSRASDKIALIKLREEALRKGSSEQLLVLGSKSVAEAFNSLDKQYADIETQRNSFIVKLKRLPPIKDFQDSASLRTLVGMLRSTSLAFESLKCNALDSATFSALMAKLPDLLRREVDAEIFDKHSKTVAERFQVLIDKSERQAAMTETHNYRTEAYATAPTTGVLGISGDLFPHASLLGQSQTSQPKPPTPTCLFHPSSRRHKTSVCNQLFFLPTSKVMETLRTHGHCYRCFDKHEPQRKCGVTCPEANCPRPQTHGKLLHAAFVKPTNPAGVHLVTGEMDTPSPEPDDHAVQESSSLLLLDGGASQSDADGYESDSSNIIVTSSSVAAGKFSEARLNPKNGPALGIASLRPCQIAYVMGADERLQPVNVLFDLGSDLSQVTFECITKTSLQPYASLDRLCMHVAGDRTARPFGKSGLFSVPIYDSNGSKLFTLDCVAIPYIGQLKKVDIAPTIETFQNEGFTCDTILHPPSGEIQILVGCNFTECHPVPVTTLDNVTLAKVRGGEIVYGAHPSFHATGHSQTKLVSTQLQTMAILEVCDVRPPTHFEQSVVSTAVVGSKLDRVDDIYDRLSRIEDLPCGNCGESRAISKGEQRQVDIYREGLEFLPEERKVIAHLPWSADLSRVPDNKQSALKRLKSVSKSLSQKPGLRDAYRAEIQKMIDAGILKEVSEVEQEVWRQSGGKVWYACHFPVVNGNSQSTPVRVVFDFSMPCRGVKLSQFWEVPPNLIPDIFGMWIRFRDMPIAMCLDFSKAYWTVYLHEEDSHMQRVLWNDMDNEGQLRTFRMTRNSFGMVPSGAICTLAMFLVAEHHQSDYPQVYEFIRHQVYVDDGVTSFATIEQAVDLAKSVSKVMANGGFDIKHILLGGRDISQEDKSKYQSTLPAKTSFADKPIKILGSSWDPVLDQLSLNAWKEGSAVASEGQSSSDSPITMRKYLSLMATLFDPLGLATPISILLKHELGRLFLVGLSWDDAIPVDATSADTPTRGRCLTLLRMIVDVTKIPFPRCVVPSLVSCGNPLLVGFCDASQAAYAACVYLNWECSDGKRRSVLMAAKGKPLPKKGKVMTIPRAELQSCLLLTRLVVAVMRSSQHKPIRMMLLSDSTIALRQISSSPIKLKVWPAVRVEEIQELLPSAEWFHVPSSCNAADLATRGAVPGDLGPQSQWQTGPAFLVHDPVQWPVSHVEEVITSPIPDSLLEVRPVVKMPLPKAIPVVTQYVAVIMSAEVNDLLNDEPFRSRLFDVLCKLEFPEVGVHRSWVRFRRIGARVIRFILLLYTRTLKRQKLPLQFSQMTRRDHRAWLDQNDHFSPHILEMQLAAAVHVHKAQRSISAQVIASNSRLNPMQDALGLWHAVGRVFRPEFSPLIIPADAKLAIVLLQWYHSKLHPGADATLSLARESFWIIKGQVLANKVVSACVICRRVKKRPILVDMAPLDAFRSQPSAVFSTVYIDLCGPYYCKASRRDTRKNPALSGKIWVMVIICAATHAAHLELVENYGTSGFLSALDVFCNFRSRPIRIIADQGSQITSAGNTLDSLWSAVNTDEVRNRMCDTTEWVFVPSGAHSFVGMAESLVKAIKNAFEATTCAREPCLETLQFSRLLYAVANLVNDRPLSVGRVRVSALKEFRLIRPNDLLFGRSSGDMQILADMDFDELPAKRSQFFTILKHRRSFLEQFWQKWYAVVFSTLVPKYKWLSSGRPLQKGDIVLIKDTNPIRGVWTLGEVEQAVPSEKDGKIRTAVVRYKHCLGSRPTNEQTDSKSKTVLKSVRDLCLILEAEGV